MVIAVLGAGPHGREVADIARRCGLDIAFFDDDPDVPDTEGSVGDFDYQRNSVRLPAYVLGAAWPIVRRKIGEQVCRLQAEAQVLVDPDASVVGEVELGGGVVLAAGARVVTGARLGAHAHVGLNATISRDCRVGEYAMLCPGSHLAGGVIVEDDVFIGIGAVVKHELVVGRGALIGAGAVVVEDVKPLAVVTGNPGRER